MTKLSDVNHQLLSASVLEKLSAQNVTSVGSFLAHNPALLSTKCDLAIKDIVILREHLRSHHGPSKIDLRTHKINVLHTSLFEDLKSDHLYELYGSAGSGKTQIAMYLSAQCIQQNKTVLYIDTKNDFSVSRMKSYCREALMKAMNFKLSSAFDLDEVLKITHELANSEIHVDLLILDNIASLVLPLLDDEVIGDVAYQVHQLITSLKKIAFKRNCAVLVINNATNLGSKPALGKIFSHAADVRFIIRKIGPQRSSIYIEKRRTVHEQEECFNIVINAISICKEPIVN